MSTRLVGCSRSSPGPASTSTTSRGCSRRRACRSSPTPSQSCSTGFAPSAASLSPPDSTFASPPPVRDAGELVERIWERDPTVWTGHDEAQWLGWLDEPRRMRERVSELDSLRIAYDFERVVVAGMGGSSLAPLVLGRAFDAPLEVLDTTHPAAIRRLDPEGALFVVSSKSGSTLETRCHFDYLWERAGRKPERFVV